MTHLPDNFRRQTIEALGEAEYQRLAEALSEPAPTSIRVNPGKSSRDELQHILQGAEPVEWCQQGFYLSERPQFTFDPLLHAGCYYVQEASSMWVGKVIATHAQPEPACSGSDEAESQGLIVLDACAAPGGKSTLALDSLPHGSLLVANEYVKLRSHILTENLMKWGNPNIIVTNSDTRDFARLGEMFDIIICDAPCSGEGMFRKDPKAIDEWSTDNVLACQLRQREIVSNLWHALKPGGLLIYSTCTFNRLENEDNALWMQTELGAKPCQEGRHFYPHLSRGEGFFIATFTKGDPNASDAANATKEHKAKKKRKPEKAAKMPAELKQWLADADQFTITQDKSGSYCAFPAIYNNVLTAVSDAAHVVHYGIELAEQKGSKLQPCHSLALSQSLNPQAFPAAEVDYATAIAYLRGEAIALPADCPRGFVIITFKGHPLGFAKNIGNRANNLYPDAWRIRTTHTPQG